MLNMYESDDCRSSGFRAEGPHAAAAAAAAPRTSHRRTAGRMALLTAPSLLVVLEAQVGDLLLPHQVAERVLELRLLDEKVVLRLQPRRRHGALEVEGEPFLN